MMGKSRFFGKEYGNIKNEKIYIPQDEYKFLKRGIT